MKKNFRWLAIPALFAVVALANNGCSSNSDNDQDYQNQQHGSRRYAENKKGEPIKRGCSRCGVRNRPTE